MAELAAHVAAAKARLGIVDDAAWTKRLRNSGARRTPAKRAALEAIGEAAREGRFTFIEREAVRCDPRR